MRVIAIQMLRQFWEKHASAEQPLSEWYAKTERAMWGSLPDIRKDDNSVDYVGNQRYVFNVGGNKYRIIAAIKFTPRLVYIRFVGMHQQYIKLTADQIKSL